jgi:hypothetical protein
MNESSYMTSQHVGPYAQALGIDLVDLVPIQRNKYCAIGKGTLGNGRRCIVKDYGESDPALAKLEADSLSFYQTLSEGVAGLKGCGLLAYSAEKNLLAISFMSGESYTRFLYKSLVSKDRKIRALQHAEKLGALLRELYLRGPSIPNGELGGFMREYFQHATDRLGHVPMVGKFILRAPSGTVDELLSDVKASGERPSFCHGDCVPRNAHADDDGIGLIDWANTSDQSHILNDIYNLFIALQNMGLPSAYKRQIIQALSDGLGDLSFDLRVHRFFYEYHRRRWLMLKLYARRPWPWLQALRGIATFAKPFSTSRLDALRKHIKGDPSPVIQ